MGTVTLSIVEIFFFILILIIVGLLSSLEKAMEMINKKTIMTRIEDEKKAEKLNKLIKKSSAFIYSCLVVRIFLGFLSIGVVLETITTSAGWQLTRWGLPYGTQWAVFFIIVIVGGLFVTLGIMVPHQIALQGPDRVAQKLAGYGLFFVVLARPFVALSLGFTRFMLMILRKDTTIIEERFSEEEVMSLLEVGQNTGEIKEQGKRMIDSIFAFDDKLAYEIMTPRTDVFAIDIQDPPSQYMEDLMTMTYSRIPVYEEDIDNIIGILNIKDFLIKAKERGFEDVPIREILRKPFFVPDTKNIDSLFFQLQHMKQHIALLIDEYGGFSGIVTMEDLIEEVMGEIDDEFDEGSMEVEKINDHLYFMDGLMDLDDINEAIGTDLTSENSETLGGLLIEILGEIPKDYTKPQVEVGRYRFSVETISDRRIRRVKLEILPKESQESPRKEEE